MNKSDYINYMRKNWKCKTQEDVIAGVFDPTQYDVKESAYDMESFRSHKLDKRIENDILTSDEE